MKHPKNKIAIKNKIFEVAGSNWLWITDYIFRDLPFDDYIKANINSIAYEKSYGGRTVIRDDFRQYPDKIARATELAQKIVQQVKACTDANKRK